MTYPTLTDRSPTVASMHAYSRILGSIRGAQTEPHPRWWHASLRVTQEGLTTGDFPLGGSTGSLVLRPGDQVISGTGIDGDFTVELTGSAPAVGRQVLDRLGAKIDVDPERWNAIEVEGYVAAAAGQFHRALLAVWETFEEFAGGIIGEVGRLNLWPHHFDISFEWFSDAVEVYEEEDGPKEYNKQVGFGFSPGDEGDPQPYFYANPWPFDEAFRAVELPGEASWHAEGWSGAFLPYSSVVEGGSELLAEFLTAVFDGTREALS